MAAKADVEAVHGMGMHLAASVARHARTDGAKVAVSSVGVRRTYAELDARAARLAGALSARGVAAGDRVAILMTNRIEYVETLVALSRLGAVAVPLNFRLTAAEAHFQLADSGAVGVLTDQGLEEVAELAAQDTSVRVRLVVGSTYEEALAGVDPLPERAIDEDSTAMILYTSGTTGRPKGAMLTHRGWYAWVTSRAAQVGYPPTCRTSLCAVPLFHVAGCGTTYHSLLLGGRVVVMPSGAFDAAEIIDVLEQEQINLAFFVPAQWQAIVRHPAMAGRSFPHLMAANWGAAPASATLVREIRAAFPSVALTSAFGMTETYATTMVLMPDDVAEHPDSVGRPMLGVEVRVVDTEMNDVPRGEVGEIVYRGGTVMAGYWNAPERTAEAFRGGWFHSGDLVRVDEEGFYYVVDRIKDMIISGGENIYCAEVENVLAAHPKVGSVAVVGIPDERWGETPVAVVVPRQDDPPELEELRDFARERLASYKLPRRLLVVEAMPMNSSGKILKGELRTLAGSLTICEPAGSAR